MQDLKDPRRRDEIAAARAILKKNSMLLLATSKAYVRHPELAAAKANRDFVYRQLCEAINMISGTAQASGDSGPVGGAGGEGVGGGPLGAVYEGAGELAAALDDFDDKCIIDPISYNEVLSRCPVLLYVLCAGGQCCCVLCAGGQCCFVCCMKVFSVVMCAVCRCPVLFCVLCAGVQCCRVCVCVSTTDVCVLCCVQVRTRPNLEERLESIISGAALMADSSCTRDERREKIVSECNAVRQALHVSALCLHIYFLGLFSCDQFSWDVFNHDAYTLYIRTCRIMSSGACKLLVPGKLWLHFVP